MKNYDYWGIEDKAGNIPFDTIKGTRTEAIGNFIIEYNYGGFTPRFLSWRQWKIRGFKCIRIKITKIVICDFCGKFIDKDKMAPSGVGGNNCIDCDIRESGEI